MDARFGRLGSARRIRGHQSDRSDASQRVGSRDYARPVVGERRLVSLRLSLSGGLRGLKAPSAGASASHAARPITFWDLFAVLRGLGNLRPIVAIDVDAVVRAEGRAGRDADRSVLS